MIAASEIIDQIDTQIHNLMNVRAVFPTLGKGMAGANQFRTPPFYDSQGYKAILSFDPPLTEQQIEGINRIGRWANQSFVAWLCALLEFHHVIPAEGQGHIKNELDGHEEIDILRRLRNELVHRSGKYNSHEPESRKLYERMVHKFSLRTESPNTAYEFPVHIFVMIHAQFGFAFLVGLLDRPTHRGQTGQRFQRRVGGRIAPIRFSGRVYVPGCDGTRTILRALASCLPRP